MYVSPINFEELHKNLQILKQEADAIIGGRYEKSNNPVAKEMLNKPGAL